MRCMMQLTLVAWVASRNSPARGGRDEGQAAQAETDSGQAPGHVRADPHRRVDGGDPGRPALPGVAERAAAMNAAVAAAKATAASLETFEADAKAEVEPAADWGSADGLRRRLISWRDPLATAEA